MPLPGHAGDVPGLRERLRSGDILSLQVVKTPLAAALAFEAGRLIGSPFPVFAALAALLVVQVTVYDSVSRGLQRVLGVVLGVLMAYGIAALLGLHAWTVGLVVLAGIVLAKLVRIGEGGAVQVPVSGLLVLTVGSGGDYALDRVVETVLGAAVGVVVNVALAPPTRTRDAGRHVLALAAAEADVLRAAGHGLRADRWVEDAPAWLGDARHLDGVVAAARAAVDRGETSLRLNPRGHRLIGAALRRRVALGALEHVAVQVRGVARTLADSAADPAPQGASLALGEAMTAVVQRFRPMARWRPNRRRTRKARRPTSCAPGWRRPGSPWRVRSWPREPSRSGPRAPGSHTGHCSPTWTGCSVSSMDSRRPTC